VPQSSIFHCHCQVFLPQLHTSIFIRFHSSRITISSNLHQHPSQYSLYSSSLRRCRNQSRSKLPLLPSHNQTFTLYSLNTRSLLNTKNSTALTDLASCSRPPDLIALQETKMSVSSTDAHISYFKPPGYSLLSFPRVTPSSKSAKISGGGSAFLIREPVIVLNSSRHTFKSFECSSITIQLASDILTVFNIYRPPTSSNYSQKPSVFLDEFGSLLSLAATTPNEFVLVGDFNVHVDTPSDTLSSSFLNLLSSVNLVQHVNFPTHIENHTLDLLITSTASLLVGPD